MLLAAGAIMLRPSRAAFPDVAPPRGIRAATYVPTAINQVAVLFEQRPMVEAAASEETGARRAALRQRQTEPPLPPAIYTIAALEEPLDIAMKPIEPASFTVPALAGPAPLRVADLSGTTGGSRDREFKERP
jgi:hypothetical protein